MIGGSFSLVKRLTVNYVNKKHKVTLDHDSRQIVAEPSQHSGQFFNGNGRMRVLALFYSSLAHEKSRVSALARKSVRTIASG